MSVPRHDVPLTVSFVPFRKAATIKRALDAELYFYATLIFRTRLGF